ncbi:MAG: hypothetical protein O2958_02045 [Gemmatimonadetes bacterium]|nr:hypothetical protein [Gemmatimonadota bacterium]MDA1102119.1 hypothetical protein [Gemmatimonadota bacterium]
MSSSDYTYYGYDLCIGGYFEMPTSDARKLLPSHLEPLEVQHERSILAITAFHFSESMVGEYDEVVLAVVVPPIVEPGKALPKAAFFPFMVGTSTPESRAHAIERWRLPHYMKDVDIDFAEEDGQVTVTVTDAGAPVLELVVTEFERKAAANNYTCFTVDPEARYKVNILMEASHTEHEEESGSLTLHEHAMTAGLTIDEVNSYPFREEWYQKGLQTFDPMESF